MLLSPFPYLVRIDQACPPLKQLCLMFYVGGKDHFLSIFLLLLYCCCSLADIYSIFFSSCMPYDIKTHVTGVVLAQRHLCTMLACDKTFAR